MRLGGWQQGFVAPPATVPPPPAPPRGRRGKRAPPPPPVRTSQRWHRTAAAAREAAARPRCSTHRLPRLRPPTTHYRSRRFYGLLPVARRPAQLRAAAPSLEPRLLCRASSSRCGPATSRRGAARAARLALRAPPHRRARSGVATRTRRLPARVVVGHRALRAAPRRRRHARPAAVVGLRRRRPPTRRRRRRRRASWRRRRYCKRLAPPRRAPERGARAMHRALAPRAPRGRRCACRDDDVALALYCWRHAGAAVAEPAARGGWRRWSAARAPRRGARRRRASVWSRARCPPNRWRTRRGSPEIARRLRLRPRLARATSRTCSSTPRRRAGAVGRPAVRRRLAPASSPSSRRRYARPPRRARPARRAVWCRPALRALLRVYGWVAAAAAAAPDVVAPAARAAARRRRSITCGPSCVR